MTGPEREDEQPGGLFGSDGLKGAAGRNSRRTADSLRRNM